MNQSCRKAREATLNTHSPSTQRHINTESGGGPAEREILEHHAGREVHGWEICWVGGRVKLKSIYAASKKTHFTEQMEEGQPDRRLIPVWHPAGSPHLQDDVSANLKCTRQLVHTQRTIVYITVNPRLIWHCLVLAHFNLGTLGKIFIMRQVISWALLSIKIQLNHT